MVREVANFFNHTQPGDYWFAADGKLLLACPFCGLVSLVPHQVVQRNPLTLSPSVIQHPCDHHFHVINGEVKP